MVKGKRVSNKSGGDPGIRSTKTGLRHIQNVGRRHDAAAWERAKLVTVARTGRGPAHITKPPGVMSRLKNQVTRLFRRGIR